MLYFIGHGITMSFKRGWAIEFTKLPASGRTKTWMMKRLLNVDEGWLAGIQNCPPQGNLGGGVDEVVDLEAVARRWLGDLCGSGVELVSIRTASSS